jgi:hypothetical protein
MGLPNFNMGNLPQNEKHRSATSMEEGNFMAKSKTVVLWGSEDILISSVESILSSNKEWEVVSLSKKDDIDALNQAVESSHASIVIMQQGKTCDSSLLSMQLIKDLPSLKVITVNLDDNSMEVFSKQQIWVKDVSDLISVFNNET